MPIPDDETTIQTATRHVRRLEAQLLNQQKRLAGLNPEQSGGREAAKLVEAIRVALEGARANLALLTNSDAPLDDAGRVEKSSRGE